MNLNPSTVKRLAFAKYLYRLGIEQSLAPEPQSSASVLTLQDAVELFLQVASEHLDAGRQHLSFMEYWDILSTKLDQPLPYKESMRRLNKARVALKHHGTMPSKIDLEAFRVTSLGFFEEATLQIFGESFSEISLVDFVEPEEARNNLREALELLSASDFEKAIDKSAIAFHQIIHYYEAQKRDQYGRSPFHFGSKFTFLDSYSMGLGSSHRPVLADQNFQRKLGEFIDKVEESLESMQNAIKIIALGLDYANYSRFRGFTPYVSIMANGNVHVGNRNTNKLSLTEAEAMFCIDFAIDTSLKLREIE